MFTFFVSLVVSLLALVIGYSLSSFKSAGFYSKKQKSLIDEVKTLKEQLDAQALLKDDDEVKKVKVFGKNDWPEELICASGSYDSWLKGIANELDETVDVLISMGFHGMVPLVKKGLAGDYKNDFLANSVFLPQPRKQAFLIWKLMEQSIKYSKEKRAFQSFESLYHFLLACYSTKGLLTSGEKSYAETALEHISGSIVSGNITSVSILPDVWFVDKKLEAQLSTLLISLKQLTGVDLDVTLIVESVMKGFAYDVVSLIRQIMFSSNPQAFTVLFNFIVILFTGMRKKEKQELKISETQKKVDEAVANKVNQNITRFKTPPAGIPVNVTADPEPRETSLQVAVITNLDNEVQELPLSGVDNMNTGRELIAPNKNDDEAEGVEEPEIPVLTLVPPDNKTSEIGSTKTELISSQIFDADDGDVREVVEEKKEESDQAVELVPFVFTRKAKR